MLYFKIKKIYHMKYRKAEPKTSIDQVFIMHIINTKKNYYQYIHQY
jgi:hypothetical protein